MKRKKILWLASWYPNRTDPFNGDFIQRHAQAVSLYHDVYIIFVVRDTESAITNSTLTELTTAYGVSEHYVYYSVNKMPAILQKLVSPWQYYTLFKKAIRKYIQQNGKPDLVHVHVSFKAGALALWVKKKYNVPYVATEHWSGLLPEAVNNFHHLSVFSQVLCRRTWKGAASISAVSSHLAMHLRAWVPSTSIYVIPNVVNTQIFQPSILKKAMLPVCFIHVSGLKYEKNVEDILKAFASLIDKFTFFQLHIVGPQDPQLLQLVKDLRLEAHVYLHAEVPQPQLALQMQKADALILYSRYETFGCVVIEANACGLPVIVSQIPAMHEIVEEGVNGIFVPKENVSMLSEKILWFIENRNQFDPLLISSHAQERYSYEKVGLQISNWYEAVLRKLETENPAKVSAD